MKKLYIGILVLAILILSAGIYAFNIENIQNNVSNTSFSNESQQINYPHNNSNNLSDSIKYAPAIKQIEDIFKRIEISDDGVYRDDDERIEISDDGVYMDEDERLVPFQGDIDNPFYSNDTSKPKPTVGGLIFSPKFSNYMKEIYSHAFDSDENGSFLYPELHDDYVKRNGNTYHKDSIVILTAYPNDQKRVFMHAHDLDENGSFLYPELHDEYLLKFGDKDIDDITPEEFSSSYKNEIYTQAHELDENGNYKYPIEHNEYEVYFGDEK